jgi:L-aminopeptidase/D-esterase-like protein
VHAADGTVLAGARERAVDLIAAGAVRPSAIAERANTTLACVCTDARLTKLEAFSVARAATAGVTRAINPSATAYDGDMTFVLASGTVEADLLQVSVLAAEAVTLAIRDAVARAG